MKTFRPILGITMGDPAGIGPEIVVKALAEKHVYKLCRPLVIGDARVLQQAVQLLQNDLNIHSITEVNDAYFERGTIDVYDLKNVDVKTFRYGQVSAMAGEAAFQFIQKAIELAMAGHIHGTVTAPINKEALNLAGHHYAGHTEIYRHFTGSKDSAMLLISENLRVIHVSTHVSLREACDRARKQRILRVIDLVHDACQKLGIPRPRIGVAGLNPHAGEHGLFGHEEEQEIIPAIEAARASGIDAEGPVPADTIFSRARAGHYDAVVAMYHDQGHIPVKLIGFQFDKGNTSLNGVNITLGIPIIRTSVDHGTAFDIAWQGVASAESLIQAIEFAAQMANET